AASDAITADVMDFTDQTQARETRFYRLVDAQEKCGKVGLVIVDECHHAAAVSYRNILAGLGCYSGMPGTRAVGFTATLARGDGQGLGGVWEDAVYTRSPLWAMAKGHLVDVTSKAVSVDTLNLADVKRSKGDYQARALGDAMMEAGGPQIIAKVLQEHAADRRSPIVFTPTVEVARATAEALPSAAYVHGGTPREDRLNIYRKFRTGEIRTLVNCMVLTEGADFPFADCAVIARPTKSQPLFIQMVGRVLRPSPATGKRDAQVLILAGEGGSLCTLVDLEPGFEGVVKDGETLAEAYEREESRKDTKVPAGSLRFELTHRDVDLFGASTAYSWLRTRAGVQFIPLGGKGEILLWPSKDEMEKWDVAFAPPQGNWERLHTGLDLGMAMAWAETEATDRSDLNMTRTASWRKKPASEKQLKVVRYLGLPA
ncbi:DEAD/DEAH box helicase, partial [Streptomyces sp. NPDC001781]